MTVIYVDTLFLLNTMVDYLLLLASARLAGEPLARLRFALGAVLGGLYAVAIFLPGMGFLARPLCRGAAAVLMVLLAFWRSRRLLRQVLIFLALACAFGGGVLAVELLGGQRLALGGGVLYSGMDLKIVLLSAAGCYGLLTLVFRGLGRHGGPSGELTRVRWWIRATHSPIRPPAGLCWWRRRTAWRSCFHRGSGPVRQSCGTRRGCWSGWRTDLGGCGSACCPTGQWGWSGGCCWRCGWTGCRWGRRTGGLCWPPCPPRRCPMEVLPACWWGRSDSKVKGEWG